jgi:LEA14-like dessication related protein
MGNFRDRERVAAFVVFVAVLIGIVLVNVLLSRGASSANDPQISLINRKIEKVGVAASDVIGIRITNSNKEVKNYVIRFMQSEITVQSEQVHLPPLSKKTFFISLRGVIPGNILTIQLVGYPAKITLPIVG